MAEEIPKELNHHEIKDRLYTTPKRNVLTRKQVHIIGNFWTRVHFKGIDFLPVLDILLTLAEEVNNSKNKPV